MGTRFLPAITFGVLLALVLLVTSDPNTKLVSLLVSTLSGVGAAYVYISRSRIAKRLQDGAMVGAMVGLIGGVLYLALSAGLLLALGAYGAVIFNRTGFALGSIGVLTLTLLAAAGGFILEFIAK